MFNELVDKSIAVTELSITADLYSELLPDETAVLSATAVEKRRLDFSAGRVCAHRSMQKLGYAVQAVTMGAQREPVWPTGLVGSITHTGEYAAAAVARSDECLSIGIDAEQYRQMEPAVLERIATQTELAWVAAPENQALPAALMLFSAKESLHKAIYPVTGVTLGFQEAEITVREEGVSFDICFTVDDRQRTLSGQWGWDKARVYAAIMIRPEQW